MKILLVTESWDDTTGPYETLYPYFYEILTEWGHEVQVVDNKKNHLVVGGPTMWEYPSWSARLHLHRLNNQFVNRELRGVAKHFQPDLIWLFKCENIYAHTISWLKEQTGAIIVNWNWDSPFSPNNSSMALLRSLSLLDAYGALSQIFIPVLHTLGCQRAEFLPMFFTPGRFNLESVLTDEDRRRFTCDIAFIGNGSPERAYLLQHLRDFDLRIWGNWDHILSINDPLKKNLQGEQLNGQDYAKALQCTKIAVNVLNMQGRYGNNLRTFEVTGSGAFLMTEYSREQAQDLFTEGEEIICFRSPEDLREKVQYYLKHDSERQKIASAGQLRTLKEHTLKHRMQRMLDVVEEIRKGRAN